MGRRDQVLAFAAHGTLMVHDARHAAMAKIIDGSDRPPRMNGQTLPGVFVQQGKDAKTASIFGLVGHAQVPVCRSCHRQIHNNRTMAKEKGLLL
jgi:hypothetical protein